jgi:hypothetical protein
VLAKAPNYLHIIFNFNSSISNAYLVNNWPLRPFFLAKNVGVTRAEHIRAAKQWKQCNISLQKPRA